MTSAHCELVGLQIEGAELVETFTPHAGEFVEESRQRFSLARLDVPQTIKWIEGLGLAKLQDLSGSRQPIFTVGVDQMPDNVVDGPGVAAFVAVGPGFGQVAEERVESGGGPGEQGDCVLEIVYHLAPLSING